MKAAPPGRGIAVLKFVRGLEADAARAGAS